jgi:hypothetical protein
MLISFSLTALYAQTGKDTARVCYTQAEMLKIADKMVFAHEADSLRKVAEAQVQHLTDEAFALRGAVAAKQKEVDTQKSVVVKQIAITDGYKLEIVGLKEARKKDARKLRWTRIGWISTTGVLVYLLVTK